MPLARTRLFSAALALAFLPALAHAANGDSFDPADYLKPTQCPAHFDLQKATGTCAARPDEIKALAATACTGPGLALNPAKVCEAVPAAPSPECKPLSGRKAKVNGGGAAATCTYEDAVPVSGLGDYVGDCIDIKARPSGTQLQPGALYKVTGQTNVEPFDRNLTLVEAETPWYRVGCRAQAGGEPRHLLASTMSESGAVRSGYAYGVLTMPYKYFPGEKSFVTNVPIGAYMGWRTGQAGTGLTTAVAMTLSSVKANTVDPTRLDAAGKPTVTGEANVAALSTAFGWMFDILKSPAGKPFKAGVFFGRDVVNSDPSVDYRFNRKTWIAIQLGYDFTDN